MCVLRRQRRGGGVLLFIYKYIPGLHTASLLAVPASFTVVSVQGLYLAHCVLASSLALNVPLAQRSHLAGFPFWAATNFLPAAHFVTDTDKKHDTVLRCVCVSVFVCLRRVGRGGQNLNLYILQLVVKI